MVGALLDSGVYDAREVAHLLGVDPDVIVRWATADRRGASAIVSPSHSRAFSFVDLVSLAVVGELWRRHVAEIEIRRGVALLRDEEQASHPLANRDVVAKLATSGRAFLGDLQGGWYDLGKGGQGVFEDIIRLDMKRVDFDELGVAARWHATAAVSLDPLIQAGAPCIVGTRILTAVVAAMVDEEPPDLVAEDLDLELEMVLAAAEFERSLSSGNGIPT